MKRKIVSLAIAVIMLVSAAALPTGAVTAKDVYSCLKKIATAGYHDANQGSYSDGFPVSEDEFYYYAVYYWEDTKNVEVTIFSESFEVTVVIPPSPKVPYDGYVRVYDGNSTRGTFSVSAKYNGGTYSSFLKFTGTSALKAEMLSLLNYLLPQVIEITRNVIYASKGYALRDLGLTGYSKCSQHYWNNGKITTAPTCIDSGVKTYACVFCGTKGTEEVPATGIHKWGSYTVLNEPTCTVEGTRSHSCTVCGEEEIEPVAPLGHAFALAEPSAVTENFHDASGAYVCTRCGETKDARLCAGEIFTDMPADGVWSHDPIDWAYFTGITNGVTENQFKPGNTCTRAQVVTFLWRAAGQPEPETEDNPFEDVSESAWYYKPVLWAVENGITNGLSETAFGPDRNCVRSQVVTFLWRSNGSPEPESDENPFVDVAESEWYFAPVLWAVGNGVTNGSDATHFAPGNPCTRAHVVTFLYRANGIPSVGTE